MQFICTHHQDVKIACNRTSETSCNRSLFLWITDLRFAHYYLALFKTIFHYYFNIFLGAKLTKALQMFKIHKIYIYIYIHTQAPSLSFYQLYKICMCKEQISETCISSPHKQAISIHFKNKNKTTTKTTFNKYFNESNNYIGKDN